jgi:metallo-beta-lactamase class B
LPVDHCPFTIDHWFNKEKILYGGCFVKSTETQSLGNVADANVNQWPRSIKNVMQQFKKPAYVIPGHLDWKNNESLAHTLKLLQKDKKEGLGG